MANEPIKVGGAYVESKDHVPNPTDMVAQYNTSGVGAHGRIEEVSPVFEADKVKTAQEILAAFDEDNDTVPASRVLLPEDHEDNDAATKRLTKQAKARVKQGVVVGGPTPAEREAEKSGDEGSLAARDQENANAAANSTGNRSAGEHDGDDTQKAAAKSTSSSSASTAKKTTSSSSSTTAKKTASSSDSGKDGKSGS